MRNNGETFIRIAAQLYEARDFVRRLTTGEEYSKQMGEYQGFIRAAMEKWKTDEIGATMRLVKELQLRDDNPIVQAAVFAAYVEMIEPSAL